MTNGLCRLSVATALVACSGSAAPALDPALDPPAPPSAALAPSSGSVGAEGPRVLSAYYGLDRLPPRVARICGASAVGKDGMPVTFSVRLNGDTVAPEDFVVVNHAGESVTPVCATLAPADEVLERQTVLLAGAFGTPDAPPRSVALVGVVEDAEGASFTGLQTEAIVPLGDGPSLVFAQRFDPTTPGLSGECPALTKQVVQLTWEGGVTGPQGAPLGEPQRRAISVELVDGTTVTPAALADDDPDNYVHACLEVATPARVVRVIPGHFHDPGDDANPATQAEVVPGIP